MRQGFSFLGVETEYSDLLWLWFVMMIGIDLDFQGGNRARAGDVCLEIF